MTITTGRCRALGVAERIAYQQLEAVHAPASRTSVITASRYAVLAGHRGPRASLPVPGRFEPVVARRLQSAALELAHRELVVYDQDSPGRGGRQW